MGDQIRIPHVAITFFPFLSQSDIKDCRTAFLVLCCFFYLSTSSFRHGRIYVYLYIHIIVRINKQRDKSFEFSSILWTVDLSNHGLNHSKIPPFHFYVAMVFPRELMTCAVVFQLCRLSIGFFLSR